MSVLSVTLSPAERRRAREFDELLDGTHPVEGHELESLAAFAATLLPGTVHPTRRVSRCAA